MTAGIVPADYDTEKARAIAALPTVAAQPALATAPRDGDKRGSANRRPSSAPSLARSWRIPLVWIWQARLSDSVNPSWY